MCSIIYLAVLLSDSRLVPIRYLQFAFGFIFSHLAIWISRFGLPKVLISDQGIPRIKIMEDLQSIYGASRLLILVYFI